MIGFSHIPNSFKAKVTRYFQIAIAVFGIAFVQNIQAEDQASPIETAPEAMPVEVSIIEMQTIRLWKEFSGRLVAVDYVEVRPQATGVITEIRFKDGQFVKKGDVLCVIDPRPLKAIVEQKNADLAAAQNNYTLADKEFIRAKDLLNKKIVSQQFYDERISTKLVADSMVKRARAELSEAKINLSYAYVKAPISGRVSRAELTKGNLVSAGPNAPLITSIVSSGSIYADFEVDEQTYIDYISVQGADQKSPVKLQLQNSEVVFVGQFHAFDNKIDPASGTIRARAIFDNPKGRLLPGMYARLRLGSATEQKRILISERAIGTDQDRKFVYVVNAENQCVYREVHLGTSIDGQRIVHSGLVAGDKVIIRGLMRLQPNMLVEPIVVSRPTKS
ncbi:MAG: efflux RND transporter periplasmic adaptor subunit [Methylophaga sp.]|nr:efflux RND transporter periplasmic adaptor subunit [Methylophaga sp.]